MRMKEDHMKNGQLKAGYNVEISTQEQVITHFGIYKNRTDIGIYIEYLKKYNQYYSTYPHTVEADAGYGSHENYEFLEQNNIEPYLIHKEQKKKFRLDIGRINNQYYNNIGDYFVCPIGQKMLLISITKRTTENGYKQEVSVYQTQNYQECPI